MADLFAEEQGTPSIEVRVYRNGELVQRELCETAEEAEVVVEEWSELEGVECEVDDLSSRHGPGDVLDPEPDEQFEEEYPAAQEVEQQREDEF